jgi:hypothetical protein
MDDLLTKCGWCDATLEPDDPRGLPRAYCSDAHKMKAYRARRAAELVKQDEHEMPLLRTPTANLGKSGGQPAAKRRAGGHSVNLADQIEHELAPTKPPRRRLVHRSEQ